MKKHGFTLVELMISVLVTSIVVIAAYSLLRGTTSNFNDEDDRVQLRANLRNAEMLLQRDIGRIAFRSNYEVAASAGGGASDVNVQAFRHARVQVNGKYFSQITVVGDITDFGFFEIRRANGQTIVLNDLALTGLQNNDCLQKVALKNPDVKTLTCGIGHCKACVNGSPEENAETRFDEAFAQAFTDAAAVRLTSVARNVSVTRSLSSATATRPGSRTLTLSSNLTLDPQDGFAALLLGDRLTPITAITYTVMQNNSGAELDLVRCTHSLDPNPVLYRCSIVLRNVDYFDIYPIVTGMTRTGTATLMANDKDADHDFATSENLGWSTQTGYTVAKLTGVDFRLGVHGSRPVENPQFDEDLNNGRLFAPYFKDATTNRIYHRAHVQSSAAVYTVQDPHDWVDPANAANIQQPPYTAFTVPASSS